MSTASVDRALHISAFALVTVLMFFPLLAVSLYIADEGQSLSGGAVEATVGVGVILRAIARRLFRAGARNLIRLTFGTMTRTIARTATTRVIRIFARSAAAGTAKQLTAPDAAAQSNSTSVAVTALLLGMLGTAASFWGVIHFANREAVAHLYDATGLSLVTLVVLATLPLLYLWVACLLASLLFPARPSFATGLDGLFIQAYFTISGSFLPMTTDFSFAGGKRACAHAAIVTLALMFAAFIVLRWAGNAYDQPALIFASAMFLTYAFVYAFPVDPLLGYSIWRYRKWGWVCAFSPILLGFLFAFPGAVAALL